MTQRQRDYYTETAPVYESMHVRPGDEHFVALEYVTALLRVVPDLRQSVVVTTQAR